MLYTIIGLAWLVGWIGLKFISIVMNKSDSSEMNDLYKEFKPDKDSFNQEVKMYTLSKHIIGEKPYELMQEVDTFKKLSKDIRKLLRNECSAEVYRLIVRRGGDGYYVSELYRILDDMDYISPEQDKYIDGRHD